VEESSDAHVRDAIPSRSAPQPTRASGRDRRAHRLLQRARLPVIDGLRLARPFTPWSHTRPRPPGLTQPAGPPTTGSRYR
jgi:hypothetical protein